MSKSLGTGIDPLELIDRFGADATRYGLLKMSSTQDVRFAEGTIDEGRGARQQALERLAADAAEGRRRRARAARGRARVDALDPGAPRPARSKRSPRHFDAFDFAAAAKALYRFVWNDVCDWYLEALKLRLYGDDPAAREDASETALCVLDRTLRLAHPMMPHVTEEIWAYLPGERGQLVRAAAAAPGEAPRDEGAEAAVEAAIALVAELRRLRQDAGLGPRAPLALGIEGDGEALRRASGLIEASATPSSTARATPACRSRSAPPTVRVSRRGPRRRPAAAARRAPRAGPRRGRARRAQARRRALRRARAGAPRGRGAREGRALRARGRRARAPLAELG